MKANKQIIIFSLLLGLVAFADLSFNPADFDNLEGLVHRGSLARDGVFNASGVSSPHLRWKFQTGAEIKSSPVVVDGTAYFGSWDGAVYAVDAGTGSLIWSNQTGAKVSGSAAVVSNTVFIASENGKLYSFDAATGATNWSVQVSTRPIAHAPAVAYGTVFIGSGASGGAEVLAMSGGAMYGYDMQTGAQVWTASRGPQGYGAPALDATNIYVNGGGATGPRGYALTDGSQLWFSSQGNQNRDFMAPALSGGSLYHAGTMRGSISKIVPGSGSTDWLTATLEQNDDESNFAMNSGGLFGYEILTDPAVAHGLVYAGCNDGKLHTFDASTGTRGWTFTTGGKVQSSPAVASNTVYFGSWDGKVYAVNATNGSEVWNYDLGERIISAPWPADGALYIGCDDGALYCLEEQLDTDSDGLPDWWELQYYGSETAADPTATAANGLHTVMQAYVFGLDPTDPASGVLPQISLALTTNTLVQDVQPFGLNFGDTYYSMPALKMRDSKNFEGTVYRQMIKGILTANGIISMYGNSNLMTSTGWTDLYTAPGTVFKVVSGPDKGVTGAISSVTFQWHDIWNNGSSNLVPVFEFDRALDLGTNTSIRDMGVMIENLSRTDDGWLPELGTYRVAGDVSLANDNPSGVRGVSCARLDGTTTNVTRLRMNTMYQSLADCNGDWNLHFWVKSESGTPDVEVRTDGDNADFVTNFVPSGSWQKIELTIPVTVDDEVYPTKGQHTFVIEVTGGVALVDQIEVWMAGDTNSTAFRDDFVNTMRELNAGVLRQVYMGGNTVSNWLLRAADRQVGAFRQDYDVGQIGLRKDPEAGYHEVLELCEELDAEPWLCIPGALHEEEIVFLMDYLAGPTNTVGGKMRADLGHAQPWTETVDEIHVEFGNEAWNTVAFYNFAGFNGADYWHDLIAAGKGSSSYNSKVKFHVGSQNFAVNKTESILGAATNADHVAIATYMLHDISTSENWFYDSGDYESQYKWLMGWPMHKIFEDGMPEQLEALTSTAASAQFSQYEFNYHTTDFDPASPETTNVINDVNVFMASIGHGISTINSMLSELKHYDMRIQCFFAAAGDDYNSSSATADLWGNIYTIKAGQERYKPAFYAQALANKVLRGDLVETVLSTNTQFAATGVYSDGIEETRSYDTLYTYAFRNGTTNGLVLINYDLKNYQRITLAPADYVKNDTAVQWTLSAPVYTNSNELELSEPAVVPVSTNITLTGGSELLLAPCSMKVLQWEADGALPQITVSTNALSIEEGGVTNFTVQLTAQPRAAVTVNVARVSQSDASIAVASADPVFTTNNWNVPQSVTLQSAEENTNYLSGTALFRCSAPEMSDVDVNVSELENDTDPRYLLPFTETFDPGSDMADVPGDLHGQHGWIVEGSGSAVVQSDEVYAGTQAAALSGASASHNFSNGLDSVSMTFYAKPVLGEEQLGLEDSGWSAVFYISTNLHVVAYSNKTPVEVTSVTASNDWNRLDVTCDYNAQTWGLELNGTSLFTNFAFYSSRLKFSSFTVRDVVNATTSYVDSISISTAGDNPDSDGDSLPDDWEQTWFGDLDADPGDAAANGVNTVEECYIAGLDPTDSGAQFVITDLNSDGSNLIYWTTASGRVYTIWWTSNLLSGFQALESNVTGGVFTDELHGAENQGFYKIEVELE
jgi:outer membrane protein assembly factor BamB/alpha-L-arabinofuranosidase